MNSQEWLDSLDVMDSQPKTPVKDPGGWEAERLRNMRERLRGMREQASHPGFQDPGGWKAEARRELSLDIEAQDGSWR